MKAKRCKERQNLFKRRQKQFRERVKRLSNWKFATGLLPPEYRGFVERREGDERLGKLDPEYEKQKELTRQRRETEARRPLTDDEWWPVPTWSVAAMPDDAPPSWDNVVRAYEEDR